MISDEVFQNFLTDYNLARLEVEKVISEKYDVNLEIIDLDEPIHNYDDFGSLSFQAMFSSRIVDSSFSNSKGSKAAGLTLEVFKSRTKTSSTNSSPERFTETRSNSLT